MHESNSNHMGRRRLRRTFVGSAGITILEFIGCFCAVVGGAWLGALYLGVDVRHLAFVALKESQLLDRVPEKWRPASPDAKQGPDAPTPEQLARQTQQELVALRKEITALRSERTGSQAPSNATESASDGATAAESRPGAKELSLAYWNRLNDIVRDETELQHDSESAATQSNATQVAALKSRVCKFAASAIQAIPTVGVDPSAVEFGNQLAEWYDRGGDLYGEAVKIWESPTRGQTGQPMTQDWEQSQAQHRNEGRLMAERGAAVRDSLVRRFGDSFQALPKP
jgi:hypothetical protein